MKKKKPSTRKPVRSLKDILRNYLLRHAQTLISSLGRLWLKPIASLLTIAVIAITLALPGAMLILLDNLKQAQINWDGATSISLFLKQTVTEQQARKLAGEIHSWPEIEQVRIITKQQALEEFQQYPGLGNLIQQLNKNPLPTVLVLQPGDLDRYLSQSLLQRLQQRPEVDLAQLDLEWVKRLSAILAIFERIILIIGSLLGLAVLLVTGNIIRLEIQSRHEEIEITQLIGATNAFIRRPFLYTGLWYGLLGALLAWIMIGISFWLLSTPVQALTELYHSAFQLSGMSLSWGLALLGLGTLLGLIGAWIAVAQHLHRIQPR
ncbi:MAG: cell division protein FtsX [Gammaproteobacteria bacterium]|nr:cell division protein FtsX [Gammaproteobacteria bacterium]